MAEFYNTIVMALMGWSPDVDPMSDDARKLASELCSYFVEKFKGPAELNKTAMIVFKDGTTWNPIKFEDTRGTSY